MISTTTTYVLRDLAYGTSYRIQVSAVNGIGEGIKSERLIVNIDARPVIGEISLPPQPLNLKSTSNTQNSFNIAWSAGVDTNLNQSPVTVYNIYFAELNSVSGEYGQLQDRHVTPPSRTLFIDGLNPGSMYKVYVVAVNGVGQSEPSNEIFVATQADQRAQVPYAPEGLYCSMTTQEQCQLNWDPNVRDGGSAIIRYEIYIQSISTSQLRTQKHNRSTNTVLVTGLSAEQSYNIQVSAVNSVGVGMRSQSLQVRTAPKAAPDTPEAPTLRTTGTNIIVSWEEPWNGGSQITGYQVQFKSQSVGQWAPYFECQPGANTMCSFKFDDFIDSLNLQGGDSVVAKVSASNVYGPSMMSQQSNAYILPETVAPIIAIEDVQEDSMTVSFEAIDGIQYYYINVYEKDENGDLQFVKQVPVPIN